MIVKVHEIDYDNSKREYVTTKEYDLHIPEEKLVDGITVKFPVYWYALIDGKLFKSDREKGLKGIFFSTKEKLEENLAHALYWRRKLVPHIGAGVGYDVNDFYEKLKETHKIEFKQIQL